MAADSAETCIRARGGNAGCGRDLVEDPGFAQVNMLRARFSDKAEDKTPAKGFRDIVGPKRRCFPARQVLSSVTLIASSPKAGD